MSFDNKKYPNRKDWRKPYRRAKAFGKGCRVHGHCSICRGNRLFSTIQNAAIARDELRHDWPEGINEPHLNPRS